MFLDLLCRYIGSKAGSGFNQIGGVLTGCSQILCRYLGPTTGSGFNEIGGHEF